MKKFIVFAGIKTDNFKLQSLKGLEFEGEEKALEYAKEYAEDLYNLNPVLDVVELMLLSGVDEETALIEFQRQMNENIKFYVEEVK